MEPIKCKAMVAFGVNDLREEEVIVAPPKAGEVRMKVAAPCHARAMPTAHALKVRRVAVQVMCNALCHTDIYLSLIHI